MKKIVTLLLLMTLSVTLLGCGSEKKADVPVADIKTAVVEALGENYFPQQPLEVSFFTDFGLTEDMCEEFLAEMPMMATNADTFVVVKANKDKVSDVEAALNSYREKLVNDTMQYPMNLGKIQASQIVTIDNYVFFIQLGGDVMTAAEEGDEAVVAHCQAENKKALDAINTVLGR